MEGARRASLEKIAKKRPKVDGIIRKLRTVNQVDDLMRAAAGKQHRTPNKTIDSQMSGRNLASVGSCTEERMSSGGQSCCIEQQKS